MCVQPAQTSSTMSTQPCRIAVELRDTQGKGHRQTQTKDESY